MDLPTDSEEEDEEDEVSRRQAIRKKQETEKLRAQLKRLADRWERPNSTMPLHEIARSGRSWTS